MSTRQVYLSDHYGGQPPPGLSGPYRGADLTDPESSSGARYTMSDLSLDNVWDGGTMFPALVVKPCPLLETPQVRQVLSRIADRAQEINAHYRFYSYTDGSIVTVSGLLRPGWRVPKALPAWDPDTLDWRDWTNPDDVEWSPASHTIPAVCSSFVWQAIQDVNGAPEITLDWADSTDDSLGEVAGGCRRTVPPDWSGDATDPSTLDGLTLYDEEGRKRAAEGLYDSASDHVYTAVKKALAKQGGAVGALAGLIDQVGRGPFIAAAAVGGDALFALLLPAFGPLLDAGLVDELVTALYTIPNRIGAQLCNSFTFDCHRAFPSDLHCVDADGNEITDIFSTNFEDAPGVGRAVSPDNIHMFWDAPGPSDAKTLRGLYGYNEPVAMVVAVVRRPVCELVPSPGLATIVGVVRFNGTYVTGAYVKVACVRSTSLADDGYSLTVRAGGFYKVVARYRDPDTGTILYGERATGRRGQDAPLGVGQVLVCNIELSEPPRCLREVTVSGVVRVDDVYLTGVDHAEKQFTIVLHVQSGVASFDEDHGSWTIDSHDPAAGTRAVDTAQVGTSVGDAAGNLKIKVEAEGLNVNVSLEGSVSTLKKTVSVHVVDDGTVHVPEFSLDTGGPFNDRAYFRGIAIANTPAQAI